MFKLQEKIKKDSNITSEEELNKYRNIGSAYSIRVLLDKTYDFFSNTDELSQYRKSGSLEQILKCIETIRIKAQDSLILKKILDEFDKSNESKNRK